MFALDAVLLLRTHGAVADELTCKVLFMVSCVGETSIGNNDEDCTFNCSCALRIVEKVSATLPCPNCIILAKFAKPIVCLPSKSKSEELYAHIVLMFVPFSLLTIH